MAECPATGLAGRRLLMLAAVRAIAPVAGSPPNKAEARLADALADELLIGAVPESRHAVGHHRRQQRLDPGEEGDGERGRLASASIFASEKAGRAGNGQPAGHPESRADRVHGEGQQPDQDGAGGDRDQEGGERRGAQRRSMMIRASEPAATAVVVGIDPVEDA